MSSIAKLCAVLNTLENVEVKGRGNMDRMLGCIQTIEKVVEELKAPPAPPTDQEVANGR